MPSTVRQALPPVRQLALLITACSLAPLAQAAFIEDSSATLTTTSIYLNRDFREGTAQSLREEAGVGMLLDLQSGFTEGPVGFGVDVLGMAAFKLDSGGGRTGTDLLPVQDDGGTPDSFGRLGATAKVRLGQSELRYGSHVPELPVVKASDSRLLPQVYEGGLLRSQDIKGLTLLGGRLGQVIDRASTNSEDLILNSKNRRYAAGVQADHLDLAGFDYQLMPAVSARYYFGDLDDVYRQHFFGLLGKQALGGGTLSADLRLMVSNDSGEARAGKIDNRAFSGMLAYAQGAHKLGLGWQQMSGDTGYVYLDGSDPFVVNFVQINDFGNPDERSWQARYDLDFKSLGVPGLTFMARYVSGDDARVMRSTATGGEWERNLEMKYVVQEGPLKDLYVRLRHASFRSDFARDADEARVIVGYSLAIW